jgi:hypothetical protein
MNTQSLGIIYNEKILFISVMQKLLINNLFFSIAGTASYLWRVSGSDCRMTLVRRD